MDINVLQDLIGNWGFPVVCCIALFKQTENLRKTFDETIDKLSGVIDKNTDAVDRLLERMERVEK